MIVHLLFFICERIVYFYLAYAIGYHAVSNYGYIRPPFL